MILWFRWMQKLYWNNDAFKDSTNFEHIKTHFYWSHDTIVSSSSILHCRRALDGLLTDLWPRSTPRMSSLTDLFLTLGHCKNKNFGAHPWRVNSISNIERILKSMYKLIVSTVETNNLIFLEGGNLEGSLCETRGGVKIDIYFITKWCYFQCLVWPLQHLMLGIIL